MVNIVIIEDDQDIRELVLYTLNSNQMNGLGYESFKEFLSADLKSNEIDLILLDIMLPEENGLEILAKLRLMSGFNDTPIIMLTAKGSELDKVKALDLGADDYIVKPFGVLELVSRIKARLRRSKKVSNLSFNELSLNKEKYEVHVNDQKVELTNKEFELLEYLLNNQNIVLSREKILEKIWGYDFEGESRTLDIHISTLRKNLLSAAKYIQTVRGIGYKIGDSND